MKIIKERKHNEETIYERRFTGMDGHGGYSFPCDKVGFVDTTKLAPVAIQNLLYCLHLSSLTNEVIDNGIVSWTHKWTEHACGECEVCGGEVTLDGFTCTCETCGTDYNFCGQRLSPRHLWGEETGEHPADILRSRAGRRELMPWDDED